MAQGNPFPEFYRLCVRNMLKGTLLSIVPAGAFYFFVFPYNAQQLAALGILGVLDLLIFFPVDIAVLRWSLRDVKRAFEPDADDAAKRAGLIAALDAPRRGVFPRFFWGHAVAASAGVPPLGVAADRWFGPR